MKSRTLSQTLCACVILASALACFPAPVGTRVVTTRYQVEHHGVTPAPRGPTAMGPIAPARRVSVEARGSLTAVDPSNATRAAGSPGDLVIRGTGSARVGFTPIDRFELGANIEFASGGWTTPVAQDGSNTDVAQFMMMRGGLQARGILAGNSRFGLGGSLETSFASLPYVRRVDTDETVTFTDGTGQSTTTTSRTQTQRVEHTVAPYVGVGLHLAGEPIRGLHLAGGTMVQNQVTFAGRAAAERTCTTRNGGPEQCVGASDSSIPLTRHGVVGTAWLSAAYTIGVFTVLGQFHGNFATSLQGGNNWPIGGDLAMRLTF